MEIDNGSVSVAENSTTIFTRSARNSPSLNDNMHINAMEFSETSPASPSSAYLDGRIAAVADSVEPLANKIDTNGDTSLKSAEITLNESATDATGHIDIADSIDQSKLLNITEPCSESIYILDENEYFQNAFIELGRRTWPSSMGAQNYTKGCIWSPDGSCVLVPVHLDGMHVIELPRDLYTTQIVSSERDLSKLNTAVHVSEGGTVYDYVWYPFMDSNLPVTCCWLASRQHEPIHMWDAFNGELRCTYRGYDSVDEVESAIAITFTNDGERVIGGYKKSLKIFDTNVPGRDISAIPVKQAASCFAFTKDNDDTVTAGSWAGYINHYDLRAPKLGSLFTLGGHNGGITWLRYAALADGDSWTLFSGARKDNKILEWDMRNYTAPVREFFRNVATNQRIYFDLSPQEKRWLVSGDTEGKIRIWDLQSNAEESLPLHGDCCNGVSFHPTLPILATSSGQHHLVDISQDSPKPKSKTPLQEDKIVDYENAFMMWWIGKSVEYTERN